MYINMTQPHPWLREFEVEIEPERVKQKFDEAIDQILKDVDIPGFRRGHAPRDLVERKFSSMLEAQTANDLIREAYAQAIEEQKLRPLKARPLTDYELTPDRRLKFKFSLEVLPEFEVKDYLGIPLRKPEPRGFDAEFERRIRNLQERLADYTSVNRPAQPGDYVLCDYVITDENGNEVAQKTNTLMEVGSSSNFPEVNAELIGVNPGDERDFRVRLPDDFQPKEYAGRLLAFHLGVRSIKEKHLPEIDEEFAQNLGYTSLDELRVVLNESILKDQEEEVRQALLDQIHQYLLERVDVEPPPSLVDEALEEIQLRLKLSDKELEHERERLAAIARRKAVFNMIIARIAQQENIEVTDEERDQILNDYVADNRISLEQAEILKERESFRYRLLEDKVMSFLLEKAQITRPEEPS